jgi:hypothetical protein
VADLDPAARRPSWFRRVLRATHFAFSDGGAVATALAGFLVRGGIVLLTLPIVVLPSVIDIAGITGVDAISIAGQPTPWLVAVIGLVILAAAAWLVVAVLAGSVVDYWLVQMKLGAFAGWAEPDQVEGAAGGRPSGGTVHPGKAQHSGRASAARRLDLPGGGLLWTMSMIRVVCALPLAAALTWVTTQIFDATYDQLLTPTDLATPLPVRVVMAATGPVTVVVGVWLLSESFGAIAIRRAILDRRGFMRSLQGALEQVVRRPITSLTTLILSFGTSAGALILALAACAWAFDACRVVARTHFLTAALGPVIDLRALVFAFTAIVLVLAWSVALLVAAVTSAWRSALFTEEAADEGREAAAVPGEGIAEVGLSGLATERTGD